MKKILIAEDNVVNRELLRELLELRGYSVDEACNGQEVLDAIRQSRPDVLLLDLGMPVMDGFTTLARIRENSILATLPVVAVTAFAMRGDQEKTIAAGFDGYLSKPLNSASLDAVLQRIWNKRDDAKAVPQL